MNKIHDVVVVGAGPGGAAAAYYLARSGLDVVLVDKAEFPREKTCGDGLTPRALDILRDMGILEEAASFAFRINGIEVHDTKGKYVTAPIPRNNSFPNYLLIAPRLKLDEIVCHRAIASGARFQGNVRVRGVNQFEDYAEVIADHQGGAVRINGRVVIMAVGANLSLLRNMGILKKTPELILAARGYFNGVEEMNDRLQVHFAEVPLPGYGWMFPISETAANIGIGFWKSWEPWRKPPASARTALEHFLANNPMMKVMLARAKLDGAIKGYPLRIDFPSSTTHSGRVLMVGESAGLVSPLTGEGIDFALESGQLAAKFLLGKFERGDLSTTGLADYDHLLRDHFQRLIVFLNRIRHLYVNPFLVNKAIRATLKFPELKDLLVKVLLSQEDAASMITFSVIRKVILGV